MEISRLFDELKEAAPRNFSDYNRIIGEVISGIAEKYGIAKAGYSISMPPIMPFVSDISKYATLFDNGTQPESSPIRLVYPFAKNGNIEFWVCSQKKDGFLPDEQWTIEIIARQFYYILYKLAFETFYDKLAVTDLSTGIPNLEAFMRFCSSLIESGKIGSYTALYFNIHNFKSIHRSLTYLEGNKVMEKYCRTVSRAVSKNEIVARLGGDNFVALVFDINKDYFMDLIQNMVIKYEKDGKILVFPFGARIGAAKLSDERNSGEIMMHISIAYQAACETRVTLSYYDLKTSLSIIERKIILSKFYRAVNDREFFVMYQPKVGVKTRTLLGAEALVRWKSGSDYIMPAQFISVLEKDGCICTLDYYILEEVCKLQSRLLKMGMEPVKISVNFSKRHLSNNKLVEEIAEIIDRYEVPHGLIEVELTESEDYHNHSAMKDVVDDLSLLGIKTSIDDFGTGYSSLGMLRTLQLDELKIDKSFIPENKNDTSKQMLMLKGVVNLAKSLGLTIVAEGVETPEQLELIESMGCDIVQGYIFDKPLLESEYIERVKQKAYNSQMEVPND